MFQDSYCFEMIQAFLGCFMGVSRLFRVVSRVFYLLFRVVLNKYRREFQGYFVGCFNDVFRGVQGYFMLTLKVYGCFKGKIEGYFQGLSK